MIGGLTFWKSPCLLHDRPPRFLEYPVYSNLSRTSTGPVDDDPPCGINSPLPQSGLLSFRRAGALRTSLLAATRSLQGSDVKVAVFLAG